MTTATAATLTPGQKVLYDAQTFDHRGISTGRYVTKVGTYVGETEGGDYALVRGEFGFHNGWVEWRHIRAA